MRFCERPMRRVIVTGSIYLAAASLAPAGTTKGRVVDLKQSGIDNVRVEVLHPVTLAPLRVGGRPLTTRSATADDPVKNVKEGDYEIPIPDAVTQGLNYRVALRFTKLGRKEVLLRDIDAKEDNTISVIEPEEDRPPYTFTPEQIDALHHERFHHPHPRVQLKMEVVYLKSQGLPHEEICRLTRISEITLRTYLRQYQEGGIKRLKRLDRTETTGVSVHGSDCHDRSARQ